MLNIIGGLMVFFFTFCYVPQVVKLIQRKSSEDLSVWMFSLTLAGDTCGLIYMNANQFLPWLFANYLLGGIFCSISIFLYYKYKWPKLPKQRRMTNWECGLMNKIIRDSFEEK